MDTKQILILIGFAIYYFLRSSGNKDKKQKKAAPKRRQPQTSSAQPQKSLEEILRDLANQGNEPEKPKEESTPTVIEYESPKVSPIKVVEPEVKETTRIVLEDDDDDESNSSEFDLRQAVINDAILNRPWE